MDWFWAEIPRARQRQQPMELQSKYDWYEVYNTNHNFYSDHSGGGSSGQSSWRWTHHLATLEMTAFWSSLYFFTTSDSLRSTFL